MPDLPFPRGVRDLMPNEALFRNEIIGTMENVFRSFGFLTIDTPSFESLKILKAKNGIGEDTRLIYELSNEDLGLRYDNTVSLARYMNMHQGLPLPFKRYYIGKVWRREEPQRMRYREFLQADIDIVGGNKDIADAEIIAAGAKTFERIGIDYVVQINERNLFDMILKKFGVKQEQLTNVMRTVDKIKKIGESKVVETLKNFGLTGEVVDQIVAFVGIEETEIEKLNYAEAILESDSATKPLKRTLELLKLYDLKGKLEINFSLVRGLDYYTGIVFEFLPTDEDKSSSMAGGGRYDNLIGLYGPKSIPAVGMAFGIDRILDKLNYSDSLKHTYAKVFIAYIKESNYNYAVRVANWLRENSIPTDLNAATRNLTNQLSYANSLKMKYVIIVGDSEEKSSKIKLRNLITGNEKLISREEALEILESD